MYVARPTGLLLSSFTLHEHADAPTLATLKPPSLLGAGAITVGEVPYTVEEPSWVGRVTTLLFEGVEVGRSERPSPWKREMRASFALEVSGDLGPFRLAPLGLFKTGYAVSHADTGDAVGAIDQPRVLRREFRVDLPSTVPLLAQAFLTLVVVTEIRRQQSS